MGDMLQKRCEMDFVERLGPIQDKPLAVQIIWNKVRHRSNPTYACLNNKLIHRPPQIDPMLGVFVWKDKFFYYETTKAIRPKMRQSVKAPGQHLSGTLLSFRGQKDKLLLREIVKKSHKKCVAGDC